MNSNDTDILEGPPRGPEANRSIARALGLRGASSLYVLAPDNDPFACGRAGHRKAGEWFANLWGEIGFTDGVHLRRIHYRLVADVTRLLPDGEPYINTLSCWAKLGAASKYARILGLVDVEAFVDRRNSPAIRHLTPRDSPPTPAVVFRSPQWRLPEIEPETLAEVSLELPSPFAFGYDYDPDDQPVLLELWAEKSTMRDVLQPLCEGLHVNYAEASGFESITHAVEFLRRVEEHGKPGHILYVSDFDPAGESMPVAVARQLQYWRETLRIEEDVSLAPVVLTKEQVERYQLPREPVKDTDRRRNGFNARHGDEGATELDALEALRPGELASIVREAVKPWVDATLRGRLMSVDREAEDLIGRVWDAESQELQAEAERLQEEARGEAAKIAPQIADLVSEQLRSLEPFERRSEELMAKAQEIADGIEGLELPDRPQPEIALANDGLLFDSRRDWVEQLDLFKAKQHGMPLDFGEEL
jgi:hypothetical protein